MRDQTGADFRFLADVPVLITDGDQRASLAAARDLIRSGCVIYVGASGRFSLAGASKGARRARLRSNPKTAPKQYAREVGEVASRLGVRVILPATDASVRALLLHASELPDSASLPLPLLETFELASDKVRMLAMASHAGLGVPTSALVASRDDTAAAADWSDYPAILKPRASVVSLPDGRFRSLGVQVVNSREQCLRVLQDLPDTAFPVLIQQRVEGAGEGVFLLRWNGRTVARFAHRRIREKPPGGGVSVFRESVAPSPSLLTAAERMLAALDWQGVAMVECKYDSASGTHVFMEVNGRLWGSLQLAVDAGVRFPSLLVASALGFDVAGPSAYSVGVRSRWLWGDVDHLYARLRYGNEELHLPNTAPSRVRAVAQFLAHRRGRDRFEVERWRDLGPLLVESARRLKLLS